jgi:hypothetical protein
MRLVLVALDGIRDFLGRVAAEMMVLAEHRSEARHLPHQPFLDCDLRPLVLNGIEAAELAAKIEEDRA